MVVKAVVDLLNIKRRILIVGSGPFIMAALLAFLLLSSGMRSYAQDEPAPPPSKALTKSERDALTSKTKPKDRTKLALELMNLRLATAEQNKSSENFEAAYREMGAFHGLLDEMVNYLVDADRRGLKVLDEFKRMDIGLRAFLPRIEGIRRELPLDYDEYLRALLRHVRAARAKAADPFFEDSLVPGT